jgi:Skp family chaperone for outer membrane proteins
LNTTGFQKYVPAALVLALSAVLTTFVCWGTGIAQAQQATGMPVFGNVNVQQVLNESKQRKADFEELNGLVQSMRSAMTQLNEGGARFLTDVEIKELAALLEKKTPTDVEKKRISELDDKGSLKVVQKQRLETNNAATPEQNKQLADLNTMEQKGLVVLKALSEDYARRVEAKEVELNNKTVLAIKATIGTVAKEKGISVVYDSQVAIYTANDLTDEVIKQINK